MELDEDSDVPEERDDRNELRRFAAEAELFQSWASIEASRRRMLAWEWAAGATALLMGYMTLVLVGFKQITWLDIGSGFLLLMTMIGIIKYELECARALDKVAGPDASGGAAPAGSPVGATSPSGGSPALGRL